MGIDDPICLYSSAGDITFNGGSSNTNGILWAPSGTVCFNGAGGTLTGKIYGGGIELANKMTIDYRTGITPDLSVLGIKK